MIFGRVNDRHEILLELAVRDFEDQEHPIEAVLDTGFTGSLTLPPAAITTLGLPWNSRSRVVLANGSVEQFDIFEATVIWDDSPRPILVQAVDTGPLVGMALLIGYDLWVRVLDGGTVRLEAIP